MHQSGVKAMEILTRSSCIKIATGGDDGSIGIIELDSKLTPTVKLFELAHSSSVTGITFRSPNVIFSFSIDQRIKEWNIKESLVLNGELIVDIPDISDMALSGNSLVIVGHGLQTFELDPFKF